MRATEIPAARIATSSERLARAPSPTRAPMRVAMGKI